MPSSPLRIDIIDELVHQLPEVHTKLGIDEYCKLQRRVDFLWVVRDEVFETEQESIRKRIKQLLEQKNSTP